MSWWKGSRVIAMEWVKPHGWMMHMCDMHEHWLNAPLLCFIADSLCVNLTKTHNNQKEKQSELHLLVFFWISKLFALWHYFHNKLNIHPQYSHYHTWPFYSMVNVIIFSLLLFLVYYSTNTISIFFNFI